MKACLVFLCLITSVACRKYGIGSYIHAIEKCNDYVDDMIAIAVNKSKLEDYSVYGRELNFYKKIIFYNFKVHANFTEGHITGFGKLYRKSPCAISFEDGRIMLKAQIETKEIECKFNAFVTCVGLTPNVSVEAITSPLKIDLDFTFDADSGSNGYLVKYIPHVISNMNVWVDGLGYLDYVRGPLEENAKTLFLDLINMLIHINLRNSFSIAIKDNPFPVIDFEVTDMSTFEPTEVTTLTTTQGKKEFNKEDSDSYIDLVLDNGFMVESKYSKLDPFALNDVRLDDVFVQQQNLQENDQNYVKLEAGAVEKLSQLKRRLHCSVPEFKKTNVTFSCSLGFEELEMNYIAFAQNNNQTYNFNLVATILQTLLTVKVTSNYNDNVPSVQEYTVNDIGKISIKAAIDIIGAVPQAPLAIETLYNSKIILKHFSGEINSILNGRLKEVLSYSIYKTPLTFLEF